VRIYKAVYKRCFKCRVWYGGRWLLPKLICCYRNYALTQI